jgi:hypothetical protein
LFYGVIYEKHTHIHIHIYHEICTCGKLIIRGRSIWWRRLILTEVKLKQTKLDQTLGNRNIQYEDGEDQEKGHDANG